MFLLSRLLARLIHIGNLELTGPDGKIYRFGDGSGKAVEITIADGRTARAIALNPALGAGEAFMNGTLSVAGDDIMGLMDLVARNARWDRDNPTRVALWRSQRWLSHFQQLNSALRSRRNVAHHYDLDDRLYDLFLDPERQYSCGYFTDPGNSLEQAQRDKLAHIAAKLDVQPGNRVLDIGCGWGGLSLFLARNCGAEVLGVTLSEEQLAYARARAEREGLADRVTFELIDYRAVEGPFDRIVSVGMFEHVGRPHYRQFFEKVHALLAPDGVALLHSIARADGPGVTDPWTAKYIFPGGYAPALSEIIPHVERAWLWATDIEVLRLHYAYTLQHWYDRCVAGRDQIEALYDARFWRMWVFYLASAASAFRHDGHMNVQIQMTRRRDSVPVTRDYMAVNEVALRG